ncbi:hypothetical protein [Leptolyngbya sp. BC1307]|uniref:hypothetical protein n=1 Tax=Leptolyngbya sp. BC1307 TaxID=2029589 RepID=UPI0011410225|nr:hypothetical protein [Leptolyngbya sp. BC1307]
MNSELTPGSLEAEFCQVVRQGRLRSRQKRIRQWAKAVIDFLTGQQTLSIRKQLSADGTVQWMVYDPDSGSRRLFNSEQAVRVWLEQRYYRREFDGTDDYSSRRFYR